MTTWYVTKDKAGYQRGPYTVRFNKHARKWEGWRNRGFSAEDQIVRMQHAAGNREYVARGCRSASEARRLCDQHAMGVMT